MPAKVKRGERRRHNIEETQVWLEHGVHLPSRALNLMCDIDADALDRTMSGLQLLEYHDRFAAILVYLNTTGGDENAGLAIYDLLQRTTCPVDILVTGEASSMGAIVLQAARPGGRLMLPRSSLMIHVGERSYAGHAENVRREVLHDKTIDDLCDTILLERMRKVDAGLTMGQLRDVLTLDTYYTAGEAIQIGLADRISGRR